MAITIGTQLRWTTVSQVLRIAIQIISVVTLARILSPSDYGLMAMVGTVTAFAGLFRDFGTGAALIQKEQIDKHLIQAVFIFNIGLGFTLSLMLILLSVPIALFFREEQVTALLVILSPVFLISSFGIVQHALMERRYRYRPIVLIELISGLSGLGVAVACALSGLGVYSLVIQLLLSAAISTLLVWLFSEWKPVLRTSFQELKKIWKFSADNFLFGLINYFHRNSDSVLIGRVLGPVELGFYSTAYKILLLPLSNLTSVVNRASFVVYSRHQERRSQIGEHYFITLRRIAFLSALMMSVVWAFREPLVVIVLSEKWIRSAELLIWLAPVGYLQSMVSTSGTVFNSVGRSDLLRNMGFIGVPFFVVGFLIGVNWGIMGVAVAYFIVNLIWMFPVLLVVFKQVNLPPVKLIKLLVGPTIIGVAIAFSLRWGLLLSDWAALRNLKFFG